jgi:hypothetical protein
VPVGGRIVVVSDAVVVCPRRTRKLAVAIALIDFMPTTGGGYGQ